MHGNIITIANYELKMRLRSRGFLLGILLVNAFAVFIASPLNNSDPSATSSAWYVAGQTLWIGTILMTLVGGFFAADRFPQDKAFMLEDVIGYQAVATSAFVAARLIGTIMAMLAAGLPMLLASVLLQAVWQKVFQPWVFVLAYLLIYVPGIIFITIAAQTFGALFGRMKIYSFGYAGFWLLSSNILVNISNSRLQYLIYSGGPAYKVFEARAYKDIGLPPMAASLIPPPSKLLAALAINISLLIVFSSLAFLVLARFQRNRRLV